MGTNIGQATLEMDQLAERIQTEVQKVEKELVETIFDTLVGSPPSGTPLDTGWASANWLISTGTPISGEVADKGNADGAKAISEASLTSFLNSDLSTISAVFISNRVSYIEKLNNGSSNQSPMDFVDSAVQDGLTLLKGKRIR